MNVGTQESTIADGLQQEAIYLGKCRHPHRELYPAGRIHEPSRVMAALEVVLAASWQGAEQLDECDSPSNVPASLVKASSGIGATAGGAVAQAAPDGLGYVHCV